MSALCPSEYKAGWMLCTVLSVGCLLCYIAACVCCGCVLLGVQFDSEVSMVVLCRVNVAPGVMPSVVIYCGDVAMCVIAVYHGRRGGDGFSGVRAAKKG